MPIFMMNPEGRWLIQVLSGEPHGHRDVNLRHSTDPRTLL